MDVYLARQPIYDAMRRLSAYELLYRESEKNHFSGNIDENKATEFLVSDAITVFGLKSITNGNRAFINFTRQLLLNGFALMLSPDEVVVEILENVAIDEDVIMQVAELKDRGYTIALDDYTGDPQFDDIMRYVDIIKVDFAANDRAKLVEFSERFGKSKQKLLAEKIETEEEFLFAVQNGYELFQGYYFSKPNMVKGTSVKVDASGYTTIIMELSRMEPDFNTMAKAIRINPGLTYKLLQYINTLKFMQRQPVTSIQMALITMGLNEVRRWILLIMAREFALEGRDELIKTAFIRGVFAEKLARRVDEMQPRAHEAFLMGSFSMMDSITGAMMSDLLGDIPIADDVKEALLGEQNNFRQLLDFVSNYENGNWEEIYNHLVTYKLDRESVIRLYLECVVYTDLLFNNNPDE